MHITIDKSSGYCFGVEFAIQKAEEELKRSGSLYCLGDIVHNDMEVQRLRSKGLKVIDREQLKNLKNTNVLIRAHGEPPETYALAIKNNIELIDASCPVVLKLQNRVRNAFQKIESKQGQLIIYGKNGHAEVEGLKGQTGGKAIVVGSEEDLEKIDFKKPSVLFSQTTKSTLGFYQMKSFIEQRYDGENPAAEDDLFESHDSICRQVSNREPQLRKFAREHDIILFVGGKKSSNGRALFAACKSSNPNCYFVENEEAIQTVWFHEASSIGICGATSTPMWLMEKVAEAVKNLRQTAQLFQ